MFDWADCLFYSGELTKGGVVFSSDDDNWRRRRKKPRLDSINDYQLMTIQGLFFGQLANWIGKFFRGRSGWQSMDWRISIRGIWDIQGRDKKKRNTFSSNQNFVSPSNGWWIITSREKKKRKSRWMKVNISPSCFFSWIDKGSAERSRHLRAFGLEKLNAIRFTRETMMYRFEQQRKMGGSAQLSAHDWHKGL